MDDGSSGHELQRLIADLQAIVRARRSRGPSLDDTEDIVQSSVREVLLDRRAKPEQLPIAELRPWLRLAAERKIVDRLRYHNRLRRRPPVITGLDADGLSDSAEPPSRIAAERELAARLEAAYEIALSSLTQQQQLAIVMARDGHSREDIATRLGRQPASTRVFLARARQQLSAAMQQQLDEPKPKDV